MSFNPNGPILLIGRHIVASFDPAWDIQHNKEHLFRYLECDNAHCKNGNTDSEPHYAGSWQDSSFFIYSSEKPHCKQCKKPARVTLEYNEDSQSYKPSPKYTKHLFDQEILKEQPIDVRKKFPNYDPDVRVRHI